MLLRHLRFFAFLLTLAPGMLSALEINVAQIFTTKETPKVSVYGPPRGEYFLRVYRIADPATFLRNQKDPHTTTLEVERRSSGGQAMLNSFSENFKYSLYGLARRYMRPSEREELREKLGLRPYAFPYEERFPSQNLYKPLSYPIAKEFSVPADSDSYWQQQEIEIKGLQPGFYLTEITQGRSVAFSPLIVSDTAVLAKEGDNSRVVYAYDIVRKQPLKSAEVFVFDNPWGSPGEKKLLDSGKLKNGIYSQQKTSLYAKRSLYLVKTRISGNDHYALSDLYFYNRDNAQKIRSAIYTDRPVYRREHKVYFRGILFTLNSGRPQATHGTAEVTLLNPAGKKVYHASQRLTAYGTFSGEYDLPPNAAPGYYVIQVETNGEKHTGGFYLEQYKKPSFKVEASAGEKVYFSGDELTFHVSSRYYSGEPVPDSQVRYEIQRQRVSYPWWWGFSYSWYYSSNYGYSNWDTVKAGKAQTDSEGKTVIHYTPEEDEKADYKYRIVARVLSKGREEITGTGQTIFARGEYSVRITQDAWYYVTGKNIDATVSLKSWESNQPVQDIRLTATLYKRIYERKNRKTHYRYDLIERQNVRTSENGKVELKFKSVSKYGSYTVRISAPDTKGQVITEDKNMWVYSPWGDEGDTEQKKIDVTPEKLQYTMGEKARFQVQVPKGVQWLLISEEAEDIMTYRLKEVKKGSLTEEIELKDRHTPNFRLSVSAFGSNEENHPVSYEGNTEVIIPPEHRFLKVQIISDREKFRPGEKASFLVRTLDSNDKPVSAAFSLGVVDEAIYAIRSEKMSDVTKALFPRRNLKVTSGNSLSYRFYGYSRETALYSRLAMERDRALASLKEDNQVRVRKNFKDTAYWLAEGKTDRKGTQLITITLPDNLTQWRFTAHASTPTGYAGSGIEKIIVSKDFALRLALPRFLRERDEATLSVLVSNRYNKKLTANVQITAEGLAMDQQPQNTIELPALSERKVDFTVKADSIVENAVIRAIAKTDGDSDGVERTLPVLPYGVEETFSKTWNLTSGKKSLRENISLPESARADGATLTLSFINGVLPAVSESLSYLIGYPYGCVEQTLSRFVPLQQARQIAKNNNLSLPVPQEKIDEYTTIGIEKLIGYQHSDGGWGWWTDDDTHPYMTAYTLDGLRMARDAGVNIPQNVLDRGISRLQQYIKSSEDIKPETRVYQEYVLSHYPGKTANSIPYWKNQIKSSSNPYMLSLIALAADNRELPTMRDLALEKLMKTAKKSAQGMYFEAKVREHWSWYSDREETSSYALQAVLRSPEYQKKYSSDIVSWILYKKQARRWRSTKTTALLVNALAKYAEATGEKLSGEKVTLTAGKESKIVNIDASSLQEPPSLFVRTSSKSLPVSFTRQGNGFFLARVDWNYYREKGIFSPVDSNYRVRRSYYPLVQTKDKDGNLYYQVGNNAQSQFNSGDYLAVVSEISGVKGSEYFLYEDYLPAGVEVVKDLTVRDRAFGWDNRPAATTLLDDRVSYSRTWFYRNDWRRITIVRATFPGRYGAMPARAGLMYYPETTAYSSGENLRIIDK